MGRNYSPMNLWCLLLQQRLHQFHVGSPFVGFLPTLLQRGGLVQVIGNMCHFTDRCPREGVHLRDSRVRNWTKSGWMWQEIPGTQLDLPTLSTVALGFLTADTFLGKTSPT